MIASASPWRKRIAPPPPAVADAAESTDDDEAEPPKRRGGYRPWAELLARTFAIDVLECPTCHGRMKLLALVADAAEVRRYLAHVGAPTDVPGRSPSRGPPYWKSTVLRKKALGDAA